MDSATYIRKKRICVKAINEIYLLMKKNGIQLPSKYQKSRVTEDLPEERENIEGINQYPFGLLGLCCKYLYFRQVEIQRRFRYLEPETREQMEEKLNDLLVYAEVAKELRSEVLAVIVLAKLTKWENLLLHPELGGKVCVC